MDSPELMTPSHTFVDFFAGVGLFRLGMEREGWTSLCEVDWDASKQRMYEGHFGPKGYLLADIHEVKPRDVPNAGLYHASFPCTDLSLAGARAGLDGKQSSAFWAFVELLHAKGAERPSIVTLENVPAFLTSRGGADFGAAMGALDDLGYSLDAVVLDAADFVPQSRKRLFVIASLNDGYETTVYETQRVLAQATDLRPEQLLQSIRAYPNLRWRLRELPPISRPDHSLSDIVDESDTDWWNAERTDYLVSQMSQRHLDDLAEMKYGASHSYGTVFRRMRMRDGRRQSTAELRTDGLAGCLRTPKGGSAKQILVRAGFGRVHARLLNGRECARLMGARDYVLSPDLSDNEILFGFGDAVCADAVAWLAQHVIEPLTEPVTQAVFEPAGS